MTVGSVRLQRLRERRGPAAGDGPRPVTDGEIARARRRVLFFRVFFFFRFRFVRFFPKKQFHHVPDPVRR